MIISTEQLEKLHQVELKALLKFDQVCRKYNLQYTLDGGTLLGAIRHKGFIPWDDDTDVCMLREDFEKLRSIPKEEWGNEFFYQSHETDSNYKYTYDKLRVNGTFFGEKALDHTGIKNNGIFLDIFPLDAVPDDARQNKQIFDFELLRLLFMSKYINIDYRHGFEKEVAKTIRVLFKGVSTEKMFKATEKIIKKYNNQGFTRNRSFASFNLKNNVYDSSSLEETYDAEFEGYKFKVSKHYDEILTNLYGDYMKLPPKEERINKHEVTGLIV